MSQDTRTFLGFVVIGLMITVWLWWISPPAKVEQNKPVATSDSSAAQTPAAVPGAAAAPAAAAAVTPAVAEVSDSARRATAYGSLFAPFAQGNEKETTVHTSLYTAVVTSHGGALKQFQLNNFKTWNKYPVELIDHNTSQINLLFESSEGKLISTRDLYFETNAVPKLELERDSAVLTYTLNFDSLRSIQKRFTFHDGTYLVDAEFIFTNCGSVIGNYHYQVTWDNGVPYAEGNSVDESQSAEAAAYMNGTMENLDADKLDQGFKKTPSGFTNWVATRNKYFVAALIAPTPADGAWLEGKRIALPDNGAREEYNIALQFPYKKGNVEKTKVRVYMGPLDYGIIKGLDVELEKFMSFGWTLIVRPIGVYFMLPVFNFIHSFIPNFGFVIIIFSIIIKALLTPLGMGQMKSAKKMQLMQPLMAEMKEKYKDDPAKMNAETMKLYSTYGINPLSGCLPLILQMPILYAMWALLRNAIQLRQSAFAFWIADLSTPDVAFKLPFKIPLFGVQELSGLALLMGVAIFVQQKMTIKDPRQQTMIYVMPVMLTLMFASFPSGLNLYYLMFNLLSIGQQAWFNKRHSEIKLVPIEKKNDGKPGKMSFTQRVLQAQQQAGNSRGKGKGKR